MNQVASALNLFRQYPMPAAASIAAFLLWSIALYAYASSRGRITGAQEGESRRIAAEARLAAAERFGKFGFFKWDYAANAAYWSDEMFALFGLVPNPSVPSIERLIELIHPEDRDAARVNWRRAQTQAGDFAFPFRVFSGRSNELRYLRAEGTTRLGAERAVISIEGVARDISRELSIDRAKSEFVSLASHQLKTPAANVRWLSQLLLDDPAVSGRPREYLTQILSEGTRMMSMVADLLNISRLELGTLAITPTPTDPCEIAKDALKEQEHAAEAKKLQVSLNCPETPIAMQADPSLLRMVFQNLLSNAIKYSLDGGTVSCDIETSGIRSELLSITIADSGIGIPEAEQGHVFERLQRASNARQLVPDGTGLGLYLIKQIVEKAGGQISFKSVQNQGTTFFVTVPLVWQAESNSN